MVRAEVGDGNAGADADDVGLDVGEIVRLGAGEENFEFGAPAHEKFLHVLGGFEFEVLPKVAVTAGEPDLLAVLRNLLLDDVFEFRLALAIAGPRDDKHLLLDSLRNQEFLDEWVFLHDPRHERAAVEFIEGAAGEYQAREVAYGLGVGSGEEVGHQLSFIEQEVAELFAGGLVRRGLDSFDNSEKERGGLERIEPGIRSARSGRGDIAANPTQQLKAGSLVVDPLLDRIGLFGQDVGNLIEDSGGKSAEFPHQTVRGGGLEDGENTLQGGRTQLVEHLGQVGGSGEQAGDEDRGIFGRRLLVLAQLFEGDCGFEALGGSAGGCLLESVQQCVLEFLNEQVSILKFVHEFEKLARHLGLLDKAFRIAECFKHFVLLRNGRVAQDDRVGFPRGKIEMRVLLREFTGILPPFLPLIGGYNRAGERGLDAVGSCGAIETEKHQPEQGHGVVVGQPFQATEIGDLANFNVVVADGDEALGGVGELHCMGWIVGEADYDLAESGVEGSHAAEAPAFMLTEGAGLKCQQGFRPCDCGGERCPVVIKLGDREDGLETRVLFMELVERFQEFGAEMFVGGFRISLQLEGVQPFAVFASLLDVAGNQGGEFAGQRGLAGVSKFLRQQEQKFGLIGQLLGQFQPHGLGIVPVALRQEVFDLLMMGLCRTHLISRRFRFCNGITVAYEKWLAGQLDPGKSHEYDWLRMRWISTFAAFWLLLAGCQSNQSEQVLSPGKFTTATSPAGYNTADVNATLGTNAAPRGIMPGITISITVQEDRTLNRAYVIPGNGTIEYPPLGRIVLENLTADEAAQKIREGLEKHYSRKVTVAVAIESALPGGGGGVVYVMGNVSRPGPVVLPRGERYTVIQAIGAAGDFTASANGGKVQLVRYDPMGKKNVTYVNVDQITRAGLDVEVRDGDWVFVPGK